MESTQCRVILGSGHRVDDPGREPSRFPPEKEEAVREAMARQLGEWGVGAGDLAVCGGANGADILLAEICRDRGARVLLLLPLPVERFVEESVHVPGTRWRERFHSLAEDARCEIRILPSGAEPFERNNDWILRTGLDEAKPGKPSALLVWSRQPGDGSGGTAGFHHAALRLGIPIAVIDPTEL